MLYEFKVVPSNGNGQPAKLFFDRLAYEASSICARAARLNFQEAFALCELLDAVDSRAMTISRNLYQTCLARLFDFLQHASRSQAQELAGKSFAAETCLGLSEADEGCGCPQDVPCLLQA